MTWPKAIESLEVTRSEGMRRNQIIEGLGYFGLMHKERGKRQISIKRTRPNKGRVIKFSAAREETPGSEKKGCGEGGPEGAG
jgi:hypothetical protein